MHRYSLALSMPNFKDPYQALPFSAFFFFFLLLVVPCVVSSQVDTLAPMKKGEKNSLYYVIQALVSKSWNGSELFPDPCGWTPIQGVSCDLFGDFWYVTGISIGPVQDNSLQCIEAATISPQLFQLKHLKSLSFFSCFISPHHPQGIPPNNWESLSETLETLEFRQNPWLVGRVPASLGCLKKLRSLVMTENGLEGVLPSNFSSLVGLERLVLAGNKLTGRILTSIGSLKELLILDLSRNRLSGEVPTTLGGLSSLLKLDLSGNTLSGSLPKEMGSMKNLTLLDLRNNSFSGGLPGSFGEMDVLEGMLVGNNPFGNGCLDAVPWERLENLATLDISGSKCLGNIPESLSELKKLRFLALNDNLFSGRFPSKLAGLPSLSGLYLHGNNFSGVLDFPQEFFERMGRRLVVWGNPNLCYPSNFPRISAPYGIAVCKEREGGERLVLEKISDPSNYTGLFYVSHAALNYQSWILLLFVFVAAMLPIA